MAGWTLARKRTDFDDIEATDGTSTRYFRRTDKQIGEIVWHGEPYASSAASSAWDFIERTESFEDAVMRGLAQGR